MTEQELSDLAAKLSRLESVVANIRPTEQSAQTSHWDSFNPIDEELIVNSDPTASTDWEVMGLAEYVPREAKAVRLQFRINDTTDGQTESSVQVRFGDIVWTGASVYEVNTGDISSDTSTEDIPMPTDDLEWRAILSGGSITLMRVRIYLKGYWL